MLRHLGRVAAYTLGLGSVLLGSYLGFGFGAAYAETSSDDLTGLAIVYTTPLGYGIGFLVSLALSFFIQLAREKPRRWSAPLWTAIGGFTPILTLVALQSVSAMQVSFTDRTDETVAAAELATGEMFEDRHWSTTSRHPGGRLPACDGRLSTTMSLLEVDPGEVGPALIAVADGLTAAGFETDRKTVQPVAIGHRWDLVAKRSGQLIVVTGTRDHVVGRLRVEAFAGSCLEGEESPFDHLGAEARYKAGAGYETGWDESLLLRDMSGEVKRFGEALSLVVSPHGEGFRPLAPAWQRDWSGCQDDGASVATFFAGYRFNGAELFDWYVEREKTLVAGGWDMQRVRFVTPEPDNPDVEQWLLWATKDDIAIVYRLQFTDRPQVGQFNSYWQDIYIGPCIADEGLGLIEHHPWFDAELLEPELSGPPDIYD